MTMTGHCLCGAVTFTARDVSSTVHACHCSMCRRWAGGPGIVAVAGAVEFDGGDVTRYDSSQWAERGFCARCGSSLFYRLREGDRYYLYMGTFDDQTRFRLTDEIFIDEKPPGYDFAGQHPRMTREEFLSSLTDADA